MITVIDQSRKYVSENRDAEEISVNFIKCNKISLEKGNYFRQINSLECSAIFVTSGILSNEKNRVGIGDIFILNKFSKIKFTAETHTEILLLTFSISKDYNFLETSSKTFKADLQLTEYFESLYNFRYYNTALPGVKEAYLLLILNSLNTAYNSTSSEQRLYTATYAWIEKNIKSYITPQTAAKAMNCTVTHLNRIVRAHSGKSLGEIITDRRITEIKQECKHGLSIAQIAQKLDFSTPELLRKYFRYHTGTSIKKYILKNLYKP